MPQCLIRILRKALFVLKCLKMMCYVCLCSSITHNVCTTLFPVLQCLDCRKTGPSKVNPDSVFMCIYVCKSKAYDINGYAQLITLWHFKPIFEGFCHVGYLLQQNSQCYGRQWTEMCYLCTQAKSTHSPSLAHTQKHTPNTHRAGETSKVSSLHMLILLILPRQTHLLT